MKKFLTTLFVVLIVAFAVFSFFRYFYLLKINYSLELKLRDINDRIVELETTKENLEQVLDSKKEEYLQLTEEKQTLENRFKETEVRLQKKNADLDAIRGQFEEAKLNFETLNKEYASLRKEIGQLQQAKDTLKLRFSSMVELKKAYRDFKKKFHEARLELIKAKDKRDIEVGNKGYIIWEGQPTSFRKVKIEVTPVFEK